MARLSKYELDAVVETIVDQIKESKKDSPEQLEYQELCSLKKDINKEIEQKRGAFELLLEEEYKAKYPKLTLSQHYNGRTYVGDIDKPQHVIDTKTIERELIVSNIKGNVDETIKKIVEKYTK